PELTIEAQLPADEVLPGLVSRPWRRLSHGRHGAPGAGQLDPQAPDDVWHEVRIRAKRARYAADAVAPAVGGAAPKLAKALGKVQTLLGEHQDAHVAEQTWLAVAREHPDNHTLAVTVGRLCERERAAIRGVRRDFPD